MRKRKKTLMVVVVEIKMFQYKLETTLILHKPLVVMKDATE